MSEQLLAPQEEQIMVPEHQSIPPEIAMGVGDVAIAGSGIVEQNTGPEQVDKLFYTDAINSFSAIEGESPEDEAARFDQLSSLVLDRGLRLPENVRDSVQRSLAFKMNTERKQTMLKGMVEAAVEPEDATLLFEQFGIINTGYYTPEQRERMVKLAQNDPETLAKFAGTNGVRLVMLDSHADYNLVFSSLPQTIENTAPDELTVFSEIEKPGDFVRVGARLKNKGIKPSSVIVGAHGRPGAFGLSAGFENAIVNGVTELRDTTKNLITIEDSGVEQIVDRYMQPDQRGDKHVVFFACNLAIAPASGAEPLPQAIADKAGAVVWASTDGAKPQRYSEYEKGNPEPILAVKLVHDIGGTKRFESGKAPQDADTIDYQVVSKKERLYI